MASATDSLVLVFQIALKWGAAVPAIGTVSMIVWFMVSQARIPRPQNSDEVLFGFVSSLRWPYWTTILCWSLWNLVSLTGFGLWPTLGSLFGFYLGMLAFPIRPSWVSWPLRVFESRMAPESTTCQKGG